MKLYKKGNHIAELGDMVKVFINEEEVSIANGWVELSEVKEYVSNRNNKLYEALYSQHAKDYPSRIAEWGYIAKRRLLKANTDVEWFGNFDPMGKDVDKEMTSSKLDNSIRDITGVGAMYSMFLMLQYMEAKNGSNDVSGHSATTPTGESIIEYGDRVFSELDNLINV